MINQVSHPITGKLIDVDLSRLDHDMFEYISKRIPSEIYEILHGRGYNSEAAFISGLIDTVGPKEVWNIIFN
jgi:hypothetical protein